MMSSSNDHCVSFPTVGQFSLFLHRTVVESVDHNTHMEKPEALIEPTLEMVKEVRGS